MLINFKFFRTGSLLLAGVLTAQCIPAAADSHDQDVQALDKRPEQRAATDRLLQASADSIPALLNGLMSSSQQVKTKSLWILRQIRWKTKSLNDDPIATAIGNTARMEKDPALRRNMALAIGDLHGPAAVKELKRLASEDSDTEVRRIATHRVATVSSEKEFQFLRKQSADTSVVVRLAAGIELASLGDPSGRDLALKTVKASTDLGERSEAFDLLGAVGNPNDAAILKNAAESKTENFHSRYVAFRAYRHHQLIQLPSGERLDYLIKALDDPSADVRDCMYIELYHSPDPNTNSRLRKYLGEKGHVGYVEAAKALSAR